MSEHGSRPRGRGGLARGLAPLLLASGCVIINVCPEGAGTTDASETSDGPGVTTGGMDSDTGMSNSSSGSGAGSGGFNVTNVQMIPRAR